MKGFDVTTFISYCLFALFQLFKKTPNQIIQMDISKLPVCYLPFWFYQQNMNI